MSKKSNFHRFMDISTTELVARRLLKRLNKKEPKPFLIIYFTFETIKEINKNKGAFYKRVELNSGGKYNILLLGVESSEEVRAEIWFKGRKQNNFSQKIYENNIYAFHELLNLS